MLLPCPICAYSIACAETATCSECGTLLNIAAGVPKSRLWTASNLSIFGLFSGFVLYKAISYGLNFAFFARRTDWRQAWSDCFATRISYGAQFCAYLVLLGVCLALPQRAKRDESRPLLFLFVVAGCLIIDYSLMSRRLLFLARWF